jgi:hypothetical protein
MVHAALVDLIALMMAVAAVALLVMCVVHLVRGRLGTALMFGLAGLFIGGGAGTLAALA